MARLAQAGEGDAAYLCFMRLRDVNLMSCVPFPFLPFPFLQLPRFGIPYVLRFGSGRRHTAVSA